CDDPAAVTRAWRGATAGSARHRPPGRARGDRGGVAAMTPEHVHVVRDGGILHLHLDKPEKRNALDDDMVATLIAEVDRAGRDEDVRCILVTAEGDHFCSGFDIVGRNAAGQRARVGAIQRRLPSEAHRLIPVLCTTQVPIVVAACDFAVLADDARVWEPFSHRGFTPDSGGTWLLPRLVGVQRARELL